MELMYVIINNKKQVCQVFVGNIETIKDELSSGGFEAIQVTVENSPINQGDYYDGSKFVKELNNA